MSYSAEILADSPVAYWRHNETAGAATTVDSSGNSLSGTIFSTPTLGEPGALSGDSDKSIRFAAIAHVQMGNPALLQLTGNVTLECWYKPNTFPTGTTGGAAATYDVIISKGFDGTNGGYFLRVDNLGGVKHVVAGSVAGASTYTVTWNITGWSTGEWRHLAAKYNGTAWVLFVNGSQVASQTQAGGAQSSTSTFSVGAEYISGSPTRQVDGWIDEVAVYASALSDARILAHYNTGAGISGSPAAGTLTLTGRTDTTAALSYGTVSGGTAPYSNQLQRSTSSGTGFANVGSAQAGATATFSDSGLTPGTTYYYRVVSTDSAGTPMSATSLELSVLTWTAAQQTYVNRGFGLFLSFNMSTFENVEWASAADSPNLFNPGSTLDVDQWLDAGKAAGMTYATLTAKHHDGFCLWPSATQPHNITASSWYAANGSRNILLEFTTKARAKGMAVVIYFSIEDLKYKANNPGWTNATLTQFCKDQLSELLGGTYGAIDAIWFDGWGWSSGGVGVSFAAVPFATIDAHCASLQPSCVMVVNNHETTLANTEIVEYEGGSIGAQVPSGNTLPAEECDTIRTDDKWFWNTAADTPLAAATVLAAKSRIIGRSATYFLNVPPDTTGVIPTEERDRLRELVGDVAAPATPAGLSASAGNTQATLTWTANAETDLSHYRVYQSTSSGGTYTQVGANRYSYNGPQGGTVVTGLTNGTPYFFKVTAVDYSGNESARTAAATATPSAASGGAANRYRRQGVAARPVFRRASPRARLRGSF